jgi:hypothetical protein
MISLLVNPGHTSHPSQNNFAFADKHFRKITRIIVLELDGKHKTQ